MPYPNEHAARLKDPDQYDRVRRENDKFGDGIHAIWGIKGEKVELQAIRFSKDKWTVAEAKAWLKDHDYDPIEFEPASSSREARSFRGAVSGPFRLETLEGREHVIVPVVALVEGVIHASNAATPELVLAEELEASEQGWGGRPVMLGHPEVGGQKVSANDPPVLEKWRMGQVFRPRVENNRLKMEVWLDPARVEAVGEEAVRLMERIKAGEVTEVSVGAFVQTEQRSGEYRGQRYLGVWRNIVPDHLALLADEVGACSIAMGCGTPRAAAGGTVDMSKPTQNATAPTENPGILARIKEKFEALVAQPPPLSDEAERLVERAARRNLSWPLVETLLGSTRALAESPDGQSDSELRMKLDQALNAVEPAFLGVLEVYPEPQNVIYMTAPEGTPLYWRRSFSVDGDGAVELGSDAKRGEWVQRFEELSAASATPCGCGSRSAPAQSPAKEVDVTKEERVKAILASGKTCFCATEAIKAASEPVLMAMADADLEAIEARIAHATPLPDPTKPADETKVEAGPNAAPAPKPTPEEEVAAFLSGHPDIAEIVNTTRAAAAEKKTALVETLKSAQSVHTEAELLAMDLPQLEKVAALCGASGKRDFTAAGTVPRAAASDDCVPPTTSTRDKILEMRANGTIPSGTKVDFERKKAS